MGASEETAGDKPASGSRSKGVAWAAAAIGLLVSGFYMPPAADAAGETRTMTLYSVNTKEKLTTTYMVNGKHVASELAKINHLLRDWRRNAVTKMDPKTIDLVWELHADLGSRAPIHVISGFRSAETNALLKNIGRNVAKRSMHIQGKAIDLYFPDVPTERLRNSALVREVGGVGFYPRSGASGFIHVDSGRVRHWPGISRDQIARIRRDYRKTVGARLGRGQAVQVASAETPTAAEESYFAPTPRPRPIEVLMMAAAQMVVQPVAAPPPIRNFSGAAATRAKASPATTLGSDPKRDLASARHGIAPKVDLAVAQMTIQPVAAPVPGRNFAERAPLVRDTLETELEPWVDTDLVVAQVFERPQPSLAKEGGFLTALRDGIAAGAEDLLSWPKQLIRGAESLIRRGGSMQTAAWGSASAPVEEASEPFPPITEEDEAELEVIIAALRSRAQYDARTAAIERSTLTSRPAAKGDRLSVARARKGDLILTAPIPRYGAAVQRVEQIAVRADDKPGGGKAQ